MKPALDWLKKHWLPVVLAAAVLLGVGPMVYFSQAWNKTLRDKLQAEVDADVKELRGQKITYRVDPVVPGAAALEYPFAPNQLLIDEFKKMRASQAEAAKAVVDAASTFNVGPRSGATPAEQAKNSFLVQGLFPDPGKDAQVKTREMARVFAETAHKTLLDSIKAGGVYDATSLGRDLQDKQAELNRAHLAPGQDPNSISPDEKAVIAKDLVNFRVEKYRRHAAGISVYADPTVFKLPQINPDSEHNLKSCWDWQQIYWIDQDIVRAVALANGGSGGNGVPGAVVKRIKSVQVSQNSILSDAGFGAPPGTPGSGVDPSAPPPPADPSAVPAPNYYYSITGRTGGPANGLYDVRNVRVVAVVATAQLPKFLDAISKTNFMSVLDMDIEQVDLLDDLKQGYYYGTDHVVQVTLLIETVWLRDWMKPFMPPSVKTAMGVPLDAPAADATGGAAPGAPGSAPGSPSGGAAPVPRPPG